MSNIVFRRDERRANFIYPALRAYYPNQVRAAELEIVRSAIFVEVLEVRTGHEFSHCEKRMNKEQTTPHSTIFRILTKQSSFSTLEWGNSP